MTSPGDIILVDKPKGLSSFDVIRILKDEYPNSKIGHAGTLDPLASGLLVIGIGMGTKKLKDYINLDKVYEAEICIGEKSTTGDAEGEIVTKKHVEHISTETIKKELQGMIGTLRLEVSIYSSVKRGGEAYYKKARRGEQVTPPLRDMEVIEAQLINVKPMHKHDCAFVLVRFTVSSGTYIRSLAEELGKRLGYPARLENLRRTQVGDFQIEDALKIT